MEIIANNQGQFTDGELAQITAEGFTYKHIPCPDGLRLKFIAKNNIRFYHPQLLKLAKKVYWPKLTVFFNVAIHGHQLTIKSPNSNVDAKELIIGNCQVTILKPTYLKQYFKINFNYDMVYMSNYYESITWPNTRVIISEKTIKQYNWTKISEDEKGKNIWVRNDWLEESAKADVDPLDVVNYFRPVNNAKSARKI